MCGAHIFTFSFMCKVLTKKRMNKKNTISTDDTLRIGTRTSPLAMRQTNMVADALRLHHPELNVEIVPIKSAADWKKQDGEKSLSEQAGGKGQFAKEIEQAHLDGKIDCGVHSAKDMPSFLPDELQIKHFLPRYDARDAFVSKKYKNLEDLPQNAVLGTCSPRRQSIALSKRPDLKIVPFRGNIQTRLDKIANEQVDATFLAIAGIGRLAIDSDMVSPISDEYMLPAAGQGAICIETKIDDVKTQEYLSKINCVQTSLCVQAEREVLRVLDGSCHTPIGAYAILKDDMLYLRGYVGSLDGKHNFQEAITQKCTSLEKAQIMGKSIGDKLKSMAPQEILIS